MLRLIIGLLKKTGQSIMLKLGGALEETENKSGAQNPMTEYEKRRQVAIYCNFLQPGGVERVSLRLKTLLEDAAFPVALFSNNGDDLFGSGTLPISDLPKSGMIVFSRKRDVLELSWRLLYLRSIYWRHIPIVGKSYAERILDRIFIVLMSWVGVVVCVCDELRDDLRSLPMVRMQNVSTCYSPINGTTSEAKGSPRIKQLKPNGPINLVYFGREGAQKRLDAVLSLVDAARTQGLSISLSIFGYEKIGEFSPHVYFKGKTNKPMSVLKEADGLILLSEYEGFPTALMEAAQCGLAIFCNDFATGLKDFERLVGPTNRIDPAEPLSLARAVQSCKESRYNLSNFESSAVLSQWSKLLNGM